MSNESKLGPNASWLFAAVTLAVTIGVTYAIPHITKPITPKAMAAVYFALFGGGATLAIYLTRASALRVIGSFALAGAGLGIFYYIVVGRAAQSAADSLGASGSAAGSIGATMGLVFAVGFAVDALAASIAGALFGTKLRRGLARA